MFIVIINNSFYPYLVNPINFVKRIILVSQLYTNELYISFIYIDFNHTQYPHSVSSQNTVSLKHNQIKIFFNYVKNLKHQ